MTMNETISQLSADAKAALLAAPKGGAIGVVITDIGFGVSAELTCDGIIGPNGGLTIRGSGVAMKLKAAQERELFPL